MPTFLPERNLPATGGREITGRFVLFCMLGFFGVIIAVNLTMARFAISTFGGVETKNAYSAGLAYARELADSRAQDARHWKVDARVHRTADGKARVELSALDKAGAPLGALTPVLVFRHPTDARRDHEVAMNFLEPGSYSGLSELPPGLWVLRLELMRDGERVFRSTSKVMVP